MLTQPYHPSEISSRAAIDKVRPQFDLKPANAKTRGFLGHFIPPNSETLQKLLCFHVNMTDIGKTKGQDLTDSIRRSAHHFG